jgi:hypothetical protein
MNARTRRRLLQAVLVAGGIMMLSAFAAMLMPRAWMAATHERFGLGQFPDQPIAVYLARTTSGLYGLLGILLLLSAGDVQRYATLIRVLVLGIAALAVVGLAGSLADGMPLWWTIADATSAVGMAAVVLALQRH